MERNKTGPTVQIKRDEGRNTVYLRNLDPYPGGRMVVGVGKVPGNGVFMVSVNEAERLLEQRHFRPATKAEVADYLRSTAGPKGASTKSIEAATENIPDDLMDMFDAPPHAVGEIKKACAKASRPKASKPKSKGKKEE